MWEEVSKLAVTQGIFAALFVALLVWVLRENNKRENRYINTIDSLAQSVSKIENIKNCIDKQDEKLEKILERVK